MFIISRITTYLRERKFKRNRAKQALADKEAEQKRKEETQAYIKMKFSSGYNFIDTVADGGFSAKTLTVFLGMPKPELHNDGRVQQALQEETKTGT